MPVHTCDYTDILVQGGLVMLMPPNVDDYLLSL